MSSEAKDILRDRLEQNYKAYMEALQKKTSSELIALASEITAVQQIHEELLNICNEDDIAFLLQFDDPLEIAAGAWEAEITGYDHSEEISHTLWELRDKELYEAELRVDEEPGGMDGVMQQL